MTVEELIVYGKKYTSSTHAKMLLAVYLSVNPLELLTMLDKKVDENIVTLYKDSVKALASNKPIQYVIGHVNFYGSPFFINENVLIPRFETEELVEKVKNYLEEKSLRNPKILDLGCGSGVIGLSLKKFFKDADVTLTDISEEALKIAQKNADNLGLEATFILSDWFNNLKEEQYDVIVSNPPYIRPDEEIDAIVKDNEPALALYGGPDGLDCYRQILKDISPYLKDSFLIAFEIGYQQGEKLTELISSTLQDVNITIKKDLSAKDRILFVEKNSD